MENEKRREVSSLLRVIYETSPLSMMDPFQDPMGASNWLVPNPIFSTDIHIYGGSLIGKIRDLLKDQRAVVYTYNTQHFGSGSKKVRS